MNIRDFISIYFYELHSKVHARPRMLGVLHALQSLEEKYSCIPSSILDYGCGNGALLPFLGESKIQYLGVDTDASSIAFASSRHQGRPNARFIHVNRPSDIGTCTELSGSVLILNGVSHHLTTEQFQEIIETTACAAIVILDHDGTSEKLNPLQKLLQSHDKGKFVRPKSFFDTINGYECIESEVFDIPSKNLPLWRYFINTYIKY